MCSSLLVARQQLQLHQLKTLSLVLVRTPGEVTNLESCQQSHSDDAPLSISVKTRQMCEDLLFKLCKLSLLILTTGTADRVVVGGGAVICPTALDGNTSGWKDERTIKTKVDVLLHDQRGASPTISRAALAACFVLYLQAAMEGNDCKSNELKCRKAMNCLCLQREQLRHTTFPRLHEGAVEELNLIPASSGRPQTTRWLRNLPFLMETLVGEKTGWGKHRMGKKCKILIGKRSRSLAVLYAISPVNPKKSLTNPPDLLLGQFCSLSKYLYSLKQCTSPLEGEKLLVPQNV